MAPPTNHDVWDAIEQTDGTPANSFELIVAVKPLGGSSFSRSGSGDVTNANPAFTGRMRQRQTYGAKGVNRGSKYAEDLALTFDVELVRDSNGQFQPFAQDLINASKAKGEDNRRELQVYDALGADYAFQVEGSISVSRSGTGWDDSAFITVTVTQYGELTWISNPVLVGLVPIIESALPTKLGSGGRVHIMGENFSSVVPGTASNVQIDGVNMTSFQIVSDELIVAVLPNGTAGVKPLKVTNPTGSTTVQYERIV